MYNTFVQQVRWRLRGAGRRVEGRAQTAEQEIIEVKVTSAEWIRDESLDGLILFSCAFSVSCSAANVHARVVFLKPSCAVTSCSCHWGLGPFTSSLLTHKSVRLVLWEH